MVFDGLKVQELVWRRRNSAKIKLQYGKPPIS